MCTEAMARVVHWEPDSRSCLFRTQQRVLPIHGAIREISPASRFSRAHNVRAYFSSTSNFIVENGYNHNKKRNKMHVCSVLYCRHRSRKRDKSVSFYKLPSVMKHQGSQTEELSRQRRARWLANIGRDDLLAKEAAQTSTLVHVRICSDHFISGKPSTLYSPTSPDWAPTLKMGHNNPVVGGQTNLVPFMFQAQGPSFVVVQSTPTTTEKGQQFVVPAVPTLNQQNVSTLQQPAPVDHCYHSKEQAQLTAQLAPAIFVGSSPELQKAGTTGSLASISGKEAKAKRKRGAPSTCEAGSQTSLTKKQIRQNDDEMLYLRHELYRLREQRACSALDELAFQNDDNKVRFYTGLPSLRLLMIFLEFVAPHMPTSNRNSLTKFQEFVMVLMRLRRNMPLQDLGYRFNIASSTASRLFEKWIDTMDVRLQHLIMFPEHSVIDCSLSKEFATLLGDYREPVFVHCIEQFLDWPRSWVKKSNRKDPETIKYLIGLSPCGLIGFASKVWWGKHTPCNQTELIEKSGLVQLLHHNDVVLSVPEFDYSESGLYIAKVTQPDAANEEKQLSVLKFTKEGTKRIAGFVRVQTESVVRALRQKYTFLDGKINAELVKIKNDQPESLMDKVVRVCCSLANTCAPCAPQCSTLRTKLKGNYELMGDKKNKSQDWQYKDTT